MTLAVSPNSARRCGRGTMEPPSSVGLLAVTPSEAACISMLQADGSIDATTYLRVDLRQSGLTKQSVKLPGYKAKNLRFDTHAELSPLL